jgi:hypothetical protein
LNYESANGNYPAQAATRKVQVLQPGGFVTRTITAYWTVQVLPYLEQQNVANRYNFDELYTSVVNKDTIAMPIPILLAGNSGAIRYSPVPGTNFPAAVADFALPCGISTSMYSQGHVTAPKPEVTFGIVTPGQDKYTKVTDVTDGTSNTALLIECWGRPEAWKAGQQDPGSRTNQGGWAETNSFIVRGFNPDGSQVLGGGPCLINCSNDYGIYSRHTGGAWFMFGDGSTRFIRASANTNAVAALITRSGAEIIDD